MPNTVSQSTFTLYSGELITATSDEVVELFDGTFAYRNDENLRELHDGDLAIRDHHEIVCLHDGDYALVEDAHWCSGTDEFYLSGDGARFYGNWYSHEYLNENTNCCEGCGDQRWDDDLDGDGYCTHCSESEDDDDYDGGCSTSRNIIYPYSDKSIASKMPEGKGPLFFGIELEVEVKRGFHIQPEIDKIYQHFTHDYIILKHDASLDSERGFEMVTRPDTLDVHLRKWTGFIEDASKRMTSWTNGNCGMHVHMTRAALSQLQLGKMLVWVNHHNNAALVKTIAGRTFEQMNDWCKREGGKKISDAKKEYGNERHVALNLTRRTAELRIFRGTLNPDSFRKNLEFCAALIGFCAPANHAIGDIETPQPFLRYVLDNIKLYPNLHKYLVRRSIYTTAGLTADA